MDIDDPPSKKNFAALSQRNASSNGGWLEHIELVGVEPKAEMAKLLHVITTGFSTGPFDTSFVHSST